jgi:hypothetical protein
MLLPRQSLFENALVLADGFQVVEHNTAPLGNAAGI